MNSFKVNKALWKVLSQFLSSHFPVKKIGTLVTITFVKTSPDLSHTRVYLSMMHVSPNGWSEKKIIDTLHSKSADINKYLVSVFAKSMKRLPKFTFLVDKACQRATELIELLDKL